MKLFWLTAADRRLVERALLTHAWAIEAGFKHGARRDVGRARELRLALIGSAVLWAHGRPTRAHAGRS